MSSTSIGVGGDQFNRALGTYPVQISMSPQMSRISSFALPTDLPLTIKALEGAEVVVGSVALHRAP